MHYAAATKEHDDLQARIAAVEEEHLTLVQWFEQIKEYPTDDDILKLGQTYASFSRIQQLSASSYARLSAAMARISAAK